MKLFSLQLYYRSPTTNDGSSKLIRGSHELSSFGYFQRTTAKELLVFTAKVAIERTELGNRVSVEQSPYTGHIYCRPDGLCGAAVTDSEYSERIAHTIISLIMEEFSKIMPPSEWPSQNLTEWEKMDELLMKYQVPDEADPLLKMEKTLGETKTILHKTIQSLLDREEKLDDLVGRSEQLSVQSKLFYTTARNTNKCCKMF
ncbi:hypothetical protein SNEBB_008399 [Seison nebaliae]|nr:hypothetical protein SNEBB_008399 [Seison nebaliae]